MSATVMTVAFGATNRNDGNPRFVRVLADLVVGGSGVFIFHRLHATSPTRPVRIRPGESISDATVLMAGLALADEALPLEDEAAAVAERLRRQTDDVVLQAVDGDLLADSVASLEVTAVVTGIGSEPSVGAEDFAATAWTVLVATAR